MMITDVFAMPRTRTLHDLKIKNFGWFQLELSHSYTTGRYHGVSARIIGSEKKLGPGQLAAIQYVFKHHNKWLPVSLEAEAGLSLHLEGRNFRFNLKRAIHNLKEAGIRTQAFMRVRKRSVKFLRVGDQETKKEPLRQAKNSALADIDRIIQTGLATLEIRADRVVIRETKTIVPPAISPLFVHLAERPGHIPNAVDAQILYPKENDPGYRLRQRFNYLREFLRETGNEGLFTAQDGIGSYFGKIKAP